MDHDELIRLGGLLIDRVGASVAYRGYLITKLMAGYGISKDGYHIASPRSLDDAIAAINQLTEK